jgi:Zn-dependent peptidase ImmA (M78 family)
LSKDDLLSKINLGRKKQLNDNDIFGDEIKVSYLKKIDEIFKKGLSYYLDPQNITKSNSESIFFRKDNFNAELNLEAKQIVNKFEEDKISFHTLAKLSDFKLNRKLKVFKITDNPKNVSNEVRNFLYPDFDKNNKQFLKNFITKLAENNILVFEFIDHPNKKEKPNINGFYLSPDVIVLKRNQKSFNREIFTLAHELGHYLLNKEEIDDNIDNEILHNHTLSVVERWCNDFAFYFLIANFDSTISYLEIATKDNDYHTDILRKISEHTHLSTIALYTRLLLNDKITPFNYKTITNYIFGRIKEREAIEKQKLELEKQKAIDEGRKPMGAIAKPIISPLYLKTLQSAFYTGLINETDFCKKLNINPQKIDKYLI